MAPRPWSSWRPPWLDTASVDPVVERDHSILRSGDAHDNQRNFEFVLDQLHGSHSGPSGSRRRWRGRDNEHNAGDIAFAPAAMRGIDGQADAVSAGDRAIDLVLDEGIATANIELIMRSASARPRRLSQSGLGNRAQHMGGADEPAPRAARGRAGIEDLERADQRKHHRQAQFAAERLTEASTWRRRAAPRDRKAISSKPRLRHGGLGLGGADSIVRHSD